MSILILAEHDNQALKPVTLNVLAAAQAIGKEITLLVAGHNCGSVAEQAAQVAGVTQVLCADAPAYAHQLAENVSKLLLDQAEGCSHILAASTTTGKNILPRVAALLGVNQLTDVMAVESPQRFKRAIYAGNAIATVETSDPVVVMTVRGTAFDPVTSEGGNASVQILDKVFESTDVSFSHEALAESDRPELTAASIVVSGGRGLGKGENFDLLYRVADKLGAAVGASRAAVDAGYVPNDMQVGQTGKMVAPDLYIAVGISGAIQHLAGMKDSKVIVAINKDEEAPIFQVADYGLVADLFDAVPELEASL
ncbi:electron transfer flavoprotein subunit alpha/FixB family protein [Nitrincola iocasae]|uniref:Electron transfer flavoprotein subunit alpha n=1 Tax=Nitrincola iocasae TaxID=2614693 RepID=A0A5J6LGJ3_9GAMM|nr:FAD-binding protein [Nitrincola iocasae]QEW07770.1 electron transfer flavoprotein subunit alpha/FixB family protein [Nitrincola iocasae]